MARVSKSERDEAIERLRETLKPGDTVYTVLRHVSRSGMSRNISVHSIDPESSEPLWLTYNVHLATGIPLDKSKEALRVGGCGMDMGFHVVYELSYVLYGSGFQCLGEGNHCPSNYHSNHRDTIRCEGFEGRFCYAPSGWNNDSIPEDWPRAQVEVEGESFAGRPLYCLATDGNEPGPVCPTCKGEGRLPNPEGPERWDLLHTDGYALRHRWL